MFDFIKNLFSIFRKENATGALLNTPDTRDVAYSAVASAITTPDKHKTDLSLFAVFNQMSIGSCVAHAFVLFKMWLDYKETGQVIKYSRRKFYAMVRFIAGMTEKSGEGLYPRDAGKVAVNYGFNEDKNFDDDTISHEIYASYQATSEDRKEADKFKAKGYAFVNGADPEEICQAILKEGLVMVSLPHGGEVKWKKAWIRILNGILSFFTGRHYVVIFGYEKMVKDDVTEYKFDIRNSWSISWGNNGDGYFHYSEFGKYLSDLMVLIDLPNDVVQRAKASQFVFIRDLKFGMSGDDVSKLQERYTELGLWQGKPSGYFGTVTMGLTKEWQVLKGLTADGIFGVKSRAVMNADSVKPKTKLDLWIEAIDKVEKSKPSMNNIGNIKCNSIMHVDAIGKDYRGLCIFPTYEKGYNALRNLLVRAGTGKSKVYHPEMSLLDFFNKYAPSSDNNNPNAYANTVAKHIGVPVSTQIKTLVV